MRSLLSLLVSQKHKTQEQTAQTFVLQSATDYCETRVLFLLCFPLCMKQIRWSSRRRRRRRRRRRAEPLDCCIVAESFCGLLCQNTKQWNSVVCRDNLLKLDCAREKVEFRAPQYFVIAYPLDMRRSVALKVPRLRPHVLQIVI